MTRNPVTDYEETKEAAQAKRKEHEISLWKNWMANGQQPEHLEPLLKLYAPVFAMKTRAWKPPQVPESTFKADLQTHAIKAFQTFDPSRGVALNTHVEGRLKKSLRYGNRGANVAYIPEGQSGQIGKIQRAQEQLAEEFGRPATTDELSEHLGLPPKRLEIILKSVKRDIPMGRSAGAESYDYAGGTGHTGHGFEEQEIAVAQGILPQIFPGKPDYHTLFNHVFGANGHPQIASTGELAKKMGKSQSQIARMKTIMGNTLRKHMGLEDEDE